MVQKYQIHRIQLFEKNNLNKRQEYSQINQLFTSGAINSLPSQYEGEEEVILSEAIENIVRTLNWTYGSNKNEKRTSYDFEEMQKPLSVLISAINALNNVIEANGGQKIPEKYLDQLQNTMNACQINSLDESVLEAWFKRLNKFKGDLVEDIGVAWLSALDIPNITTLNVGAIFYRGGKFGRSGQLIQDLMTLRVSDIDLDEITIEYVLPDGKKVTTSLKLFFQKMEEASGENKQIRLEDNGYETLLGLSALNVQAKSGLNQLLWNEGTVSTSVAIEEFSKRDGLSLSAKRTFELLHSLDQENTPKKDIWVKDSSRDYNMLADYGLATVLSKVLHIGQYGNDYVLTPSGFTTFSSRIAELMKKKNSRITIRGGVIINNNTLTNRYNVGMTNY